LLGPNNQKEVYILAVERTFVMLKPDCVRRGLAGEVISRIEHKGFKIVDMKMAKLDEAFVREQYAHLLDRSFFPELMQYMTSGPVIGMVVEGENAVKIIRKLMGATRVQDAEPGTIRGDFAYSDTENVIHGSDSPENAEIEIARFFGKKLLCAQ